jgi:O-antigen ligase
VRIPGQLLERHALAALVAVSVFLIAVDGGSYALTSRTAIAIVLLWTVALAIGFGFWPKQRIPLEAAVVGGLLLAFAIWTGVSASWAESNERAFNEFDRVLLYLAAFLVPVLAAPRGRTARRWIRGLALGIVAVGVLALGSRLLPHLYPASATAELPRTFGFSEDRLTYPLDYWNGLATFAALGVPLLLFMATSKSGTWLFRGLALAPVPLIAGVVYLTSSRGGTITAGVAALAYVALTNRRLVAIGALLLATAGSVAVFAVLHSRPELVEHQAFSGEPGGTSAAALIALVCVGVGALYAVAVWLLPAPPRVPQALGWAFVAALLVALVVGVVASKPRERFDSFTRAPDVMQPRPTGTHLFSGSGSGRWQLWQSAVDEYREDPVRGGGAGSFEAWWAKNGTVEFFVRDAHSLYAEVLGELGIVGLFLLASAFLAALATALRRLLGAADDARGVIAALTAVVVAYLLEAGVDWMWEETAVSMVAFVALGLLAGPATRFDGRRRPRWLPETGRWSRASLRIAAVIVALVFAGLQAIPFLSQSEIERSRDAAGRGDAQEALDSAASAQRLQPWAASPYLQRALVEERAGDLTAADRSIRAAIERDPTDWRLWLAASRIQTKFGDFRTAQQSYRRAASLNPRSFLFRR